MVELGDRRQLARALRALTDDSLVADKSAAALETYRGHFTPRRGLAQLEDVYERARARHAATEGAASG